MLRAPSAAGTAATTGSNEEDSHRRAAARANIDHTPTVEGALFAHFKRVVSPLLGRQDPLVERRLRRSYVLDEPIPAGDEPTRQSRRAWHRLQRGHFPSKCARSKSDLARAHVVGGRRPPRWSISTFPNTRPSAGKPPRPRPREQPSVQMRAAAPVEIAIQALSHAIDDRLRPIEAPSRVTPRICSGSGQSRDMVPARCGAFPGAAERGRRVGRSRRGDRDGPGGLVAVE